MVEYRIRKDNVKLMYRKLRIADFNFDEEYNKAMDNDDEVRMKRIIEKAAKSKGFNVKVYHNTDSRFTVFDTDSESTARPTHTWNAEYEDGTVFLSNKPNKAYGSIQMNLVIPKSEIKMFQAPDGMGAAQAMDDIFATEVIYYGIVGVKDEYGNIIYATLDNQIIKSLDTVTVSDDGDIIMPSERFDIRKSDIRY